MSRWTLALALVLHCVLGATYAVTTPLFEGADESDHYYYAHFLAHRGQLPTMIGTNTQDGPLDWAVVGHHPPLYYLVLAGTLRALGARDMAPATRLETDAASVHHAAHGHDELPPRSHEVLVYFALRAWSVLFGLVSIALTFALARTSFPSRPAIASVSALLLACLPTWSFAHGVLDNGNLVATWTHAVWLVVAIALTHHRLTPRTGIILGLLCGAALCTKLNALAVAPVVAAAYCWEFARRPDDRRRIAGSAAACLAIVALLFGWWIVRNVSIYGELFGLEHHSKVFASSRAPEDAVWDYLSGPFLPSLFATFLGGFGWGTVRLPVAVERIAFAAGIVAAIGWLVRIRRVPERPLALLVVVASALLVFAFVVRYNVTFLQAQGRYLFPAAGPIVVLVAAGLVAVFELACRARYRTLAGSTLLAIPIGIALWVCFGHVAPTLARFTPVDDPYFASLHLGVATPSENPSSTITLLEPGDGTTVITSPTFRWRDRQASDDARYSVHLFLESGRILWLTYEYGNEAIDGDSWRMPQDRWDALGVRGEIHWKVRRLTDRTTGEPHAGFAESGPGSFVRE